MATVNSPSRLCKTGCANNRCKCHKRHQQCGPACKCVACRNIQTIGTPEPPLTSLEELESQELNTEVNTTLVEDSDDEDDEIEAVMDFVFGSEESDNL